MSSFDHDVTTRINSLEALHPKARIAFSNLAEDLRLAYKTGRTEFGFEPFETFRSPLRQEYVFKQGASKARAWQSAHNYGLAVDFVPFYGKNRQHGWFWPDNNNACWTFLRNRAHLFGLTVPIAWDLGHVQHPHYTETLWNWIA